MPPPPSKKAEDYERALEEIKDYISSGHMPVHLMQPGAVYAVNPNEPED